MAILNPNEIFYTAFEPRMTNRFILYMDGVPSFLVKGMSAISLSQTAVALNSCFRVPELLVIIRLLGTTNAKTVESLHGLNFLSNTESTSGRRTHMCPRRT